MEKSVKINYNKHDLLSNYLLKLVKIQQCQQHNNPYQPFIYNNSHLQATRRITSSLTCLRNQQT